MTMKVLLRVLPQTILQEVVLRGEEISGNLEVLGESSMPTPKVSKREKTDSKAKIHHYHDSYLKYGFMYLATLVHALSFLLHKSSLKQLI